MNIRLVALLMFQCNDVLVVNLKFEHEHVKLGAVLGVSADNTFNWERVGFENENIKSVSSGSPAKDLGSQGKRVFRVLHLFSGPRRNNDFHSWITKLGAAKGFKIEVEDF